jgi:hypothetical protein
LIGVELSVLIGAVPHHRTEGRTGGAAATGPAPYDLSRPGPPTAWRLATPTSTAE